MLAGDGVHERIIRVIVDVVGAVRIPLSETCPCKEPRGCPLARPVVLDEHVSAAPACPVVLVPGVFARNEPLQVPAPMAGTVEVDNEAATGDIARNGRWGDGNGNQRRVSWW